MKAPIDLDHLPKDRRDWLEVFGNQWSPVKSMPGTCEACVWGSGFHTPECVTSPGDEWTQLREFGLKRLESITSAASPDPER